jgi:hypothetical protein
MTLAVQRRLLLLQGAAAAARQTAADATSNSDIGTAAAVVVVVATTAHANSDHKSRMWSTCFTSSFLPSFLPSVCFLSRLFQTRCWERKMIDCVIYYFTSSNTGQDAAAFTGVGVGAGSVGAYC